MNKSHLTLAFCGLLLLNACSGAAVENATPVPPKEETSSDEVQTGRVITITADNFVFTPSAISVKKGETVTLRLQGIAGTHGFAIPGLAINTAVSPGKTVDIDLPTGTSGTFEFFCSIPCGPGHNAMKGTITITE